PRVCAPRGAFAECRTSRGHRYLVAARYAARFSGFVAALERVYRVDFVGGVRRTLIAGTAPLSQHAFGPATDGDQGARGHVTRRMDRRMVSGLARRFGLISGGDWRDGDLGHFEIPSVHRVARSRSHTKVARK